MTVAVPVERYSPLPWKPASHLPCPPDHQPYCCYHDESSVASDAGFASDDVSPISLGYDCQSATHAAAAATSSGSCRVSTNPVSSSLKLGPTPPLTTPPLNASPDCCHVPQLHRPKPMTMGGRSIPVEGDAIEYDRNHDHQDSTASGCFGGKKRKLCDMLDGADDCGYRTPQEMTVVSQTLQVNPGEAVARCCNGSIHDYCRCDPDDFFPDVSGEIELPMCYDGDEYKLRSTATTSPDIMDNVIPDILPPCRTTSEMMMGLCEEDLVAESVRACDRRRLLDMSLHKMRCIEDPEVSLRRSVLIANMVTKLRQEIRQEDYYRTVLPKKRRSYRRPWLSGPDGMPESPCFYQGNQPKRRFGDNITWDIYPTNEMLLNNGGKFVDHDDMQLESADEQCHTHAPDTACEEERNSLLGDIDSIFQSLMACVGGS